MVAQLPALNATLPYGRAVSLIGRRRVGSELDRTIGEQSKAFAEAHECKVGRLDLRMRVRGRQMVDDVLTSVGAA